MNLFEKFKSAGKHTIIFGIGTSLQQLLSFVLIPLYTVYFPVDEYGKLGLIIITGQLFSGIFSLGVQAGLFRSFYDHKDEKGRGVVIFTSYMILVIAIPAYIAFGTVSSDSISHILFKTKDFSHYLDLIFISTGLSVLNQIPLAAFRAKLQSVKYIIIQLSVLLLTIGVIIVLVIVFEYGIVSVLIGRVVGQSLSFLVLTISISKWLTFKISIPEARKILNFGLPLVPANLALFSINGFGKYFLNHYLDLYSVGIYNLAFQISLVASYLFSLPLKFAWGPIFLSQKDDSNSGKFYEKALLYATMLGSFVFLIISVPAKEYIAIITTKDYHQAYIFLPLITSGLIFKGLIEVVNVGVSLKRKTHYITLYAVITAIASLGLNLFLIKIYGVWGASVAVAVTYLLMFLLSSLFNSRIMYVAYDWVRIVGVFALSAILFFSISLIDTSNSFLNLIIKILTIFLLFPILLYFTKIFSKQERRKISEFIKRKVENFNSEQ